MEYVIRDKASLEKIKTDKNLKSSIRKVKLDGWEVEVLKKLERKLNKNYFACGCQEGAIAVYASIFVFLLKWLIYGFNLNSHWWMIVLVIVTSALLGKVIGKLLSRYRLRLILNELNNYYRNTQ